MSRVIRFRAWDSIKSKMLSADDFIIMYGEGWEERKTLDPLAVHLVENVSPLELMQFTGLTDKNGVEIYEGDVVFLEDAYQPNFIVRWGNSGWVLFDGKDGVLHDDRDEFLESVEIIGNIHQHPELIA